MKKKFYTRFAMLFAMILLFTAGTIAQVTIDVPILSNADDAEEIITELDPGHPAGEMDIGSSDLEIAFDHEPQYVGLLFRELDIPFGATIDEATIQFQVDAISAGTTDATVVVDIMAALLPTLDSIYDEPFGISKHPMTTASVTWSPGPSVAEGDRTDNEKTPNFAAVVQEVIDQSAWAAGNNMLIVIAADPNQTEDVNREFESAGTEDDGSPSPENPMLSVTYTVSSGIGQATAELVSRVYPNPARGTFYIDNPVAGEYSYEIFTITGQSVARKDHLTSAKAMVDVTDLGQGIYFVDVETAGKTETHKLVVR
jgi:hypothetical protein